MIKTDTCYYTEFKIYPGRGHRVVRKDGKLLAFLSQKARSLHDQKIKALRLTWTQQWRARHKKGRQETVTKRARKRSRKVIRAVGGAALDEIVKIRSQKTEARQAARKANVRAAKERKVKKKASSGSKKGKNRQAKASFKKVPKQRRALTRVRS